MAKKVRLKFKEFKVLAALVATLSVASILGLISAAQPAQASFPGANGKIVFESNQRTQNPEGDSELFAMNPDGSGLTNLTNNNTQEVSPAWSADGRQIAFVCWDPKTLSAEICKMNADGSNRTQLTNDPTSSYYYPAWSPDGTRIAFSDAGHGYIYVMNADGTRQTRLAGGQDPNWSPDSKQIVFASTMNIYKMNADGTGVTQLTNNTDASDTAPNWSPDGREIVFQSNRDGGLYHIYKMKADGSGYTRLTKNSPPPQWVNGIYDFAPAWSPDGTKIVFEANRRMSNGMFVNKEIYVMNADGSGQTNLTNTADGIMDSAPDWQPLDNVGTAPVGSFAASAGDREVSLTWTNPADADFEATRILRSTSGFATGPDPTSEQVQVYEGTSTSHTDMGLTNDTVYYYTAFARDRAGNWSKAATASARPVTSDASPPTTTATPSPKPNGAGWHKDDVTVSLKAVDNEGGSGVKEITYGVNGGQLTTLQGDSAQIPAITEEGETTIAYYARDNAGNTEEQRKLTVKLDKTTPKVGCGTADDLWHKDDVSIGCTASDGGGSNLADTTDASFSLSTSVVVDTETDNAETNSRQVSDAAGNSATAGPIGGNKIDKKAPNIAITAPSDGAEYKLEETATASYDCSDGGSGVDSCAGPVSSGGDIDTASVGLKTFTVEATDKAGNASSESHSYGVLYDFSGFFSPVNNLPTRNSVKSGSAVPVKFSLAGDQHLDIFEAGYPKSQQIDCDSAAQVEDIEETVTASVSDLSYDANEDRYNYVWKTARAWSGTCRQLVMKLKDGTEHKVNFELK